MRHANWEYALLTRNITSDPSVKNTMCKQCSSLLVPGLSSSIRFNGAYWRECAINSCDSSCSQPRETRTWRSRACSVKHRPDDAPNTSKSSARRARNSNTWPWRWWHVSVRSLCLSNTPLSKLSPRSPKHRARSSWSDNERRKSEKKKKLKIAPSTLLRAWAILMWHVSMTRLHCRWIMWRRIKCSDVGR